MEMTVKCRGICEVGGDQHFYLDLGFKAATSNEIWKWSKRF
ncbi:hypothetical protein [Clostridium sp.]|nr:hypothetical protein [Clostridium sp.]